MSKSGYEQVIEFNRGIMKFFGYWPHTLSNPWETLKFYFTVTFYILVIGIPQAHQLFLVRRDLNDVIDVLIVALLFVIITSFKMLTVRYKQQDLIYLLDVMEDDWRSAEKYKKTQMWENVRLVRIMVRISVYSVIFTGTILVISRMITANAYTDQSFANLSTTRNFLFQSKFPYDAQSSPAYEITWIAQIVSMYFLTVTFPCSDGFFISTIYHLCGQLRILQLDIGNLIAEARERAFRQVLGSIVEKHLRIRRCAQIIEESFNNIFLIQMIIYSITICLQSYVMIIVVGGDINSNIFTVMFIINCVWANLFGLFIYCLVGEQLRTESGQIFEEVCNINWYELKPKESRMLISLLAASKNPLKITAGKYSDLSLAYFMKVLSTAARYCSMLFVVRDKIGHWDDDDL